MSSSSKETAFQLGSYRFQIADQPAQVDQIQRLLYRTFVQEVGQYADLGTGWHVDKFHHKNTYLVALRDDVVQGMVAMHDQPPFSVADALTDKSCLQDLCPGLLEVRLLAIEPQARGRQLLAGFIWTLHRYALARGYRHLAISGLAEREPMYRRLGFRPLGGAVRRGAAQYIPMLLDLAEITGRMRRNLSVLGRRIGG